MSQLPQLIAADSELNKLKNIIALEHATCNYDIMKTVFCYAPNVGINKYYDAMFQKIFIGVLSQLSVIENIYEKISSDNHDILLFNMILATIHDCIETLKAIARRNSANRLENYDHNNESQACSLVDILLSLIDRILIQNKMLLEFTSKF